MNGQIDIFGNVVPPEKNATKRRKRYENGKICDDKKDF